MSWFRDLLGPGPGAAALCAALVAVALTWRLQPARRQRIELRSGDRVLLVFAHPDDESMFFAPLATRAVAAGAQLYALCLSNGNAYGMGRVREKELHAACRVLQVPHPENVMIIDDPQLQDGFHPWQASAVAKQIAAAAGSVKPNLIITFDEQGVSGHPNHISTHEGVRLYMKQVAAQGPRSGRMQAYALVTTSLVRKYAGAADVLPTLAFLQQDHAVCITRSPIAAARALWQHRSQLVWYRMLFITFSRYTYINHFRPIEA